MEGKGGHLAGRFKSAIEQTEDARTADAEQSRRRQEEGSVARRELFDELERFAQAVGHVAVSRGDDGLWMRFQGQSVRFESMGDGDRVRVTVDAWGSTNEHRVFRERDLADRWVLAFRKHGREEKMPFFDRGLEELMVLGLGLPRPEGEPDKPMAQRTAEAMLGRNQSDEPPLRAIQGGASRRDEAAAPEPKPDDEPKPDGEPDGGRRRRL